MIFRTNSGRVKARGGWFYGCPTGWPDLTGFTNSGQLIAIEMKRPDTKENRNDDQLAMAELLEQNNVIYGVAYDEKSLKNILDKIK